MKRFVVLVMLVCPVSCSKKTTSLDEAGAGASSVMRALVPTGGCPTALSDDVAPCTGALGGRLDKYTWSIGVASTWEVTVTQPKEIGGFRPVLIVWKEPDQTIVQDDVTMIGGRAHVSTKLEPGSYRISIVNGNRDQGPPEGYPYTLTATHK
jgi:hypothetical protein